MTATSSKECAYVVFQGGGALGIAHFGAWEAIAKDFHILGVAGTSSGSIVAALCAAGASPDDTSFDNFKENLPGFVDHKGFPRLMLEIGCRVLFQLDASSDGRNIGEWLERQIKHSLNNNDITHNPKNNDITFQELYEQTKIYLEVVACDLKDENRQPIFFSSEHEKTTPISQAVRASISLPGLFKPVRIGNRDCVDGGALLNFPISNLYDLAKSKDCCLIGVRFKKTNRYSNPFNVRHVCSRMYDIAMSSSSEVPKKVQDYEKFAIIELDVQRFNPFNFKLKEKELENLRTLGKIATEQQLTSLKRNLNHMRSRLSDQLPPGKKESVARAQHWLSNDIIPNIEEYCKPILMQKNECESETFYIEIEEYLERISESLLHKNLELLEDRISLSSLQELGINSNNFNLINPSLSNSDVYSEVLDLIKSKIPNHLLEKPDIIDRIDFLKEKIKRTLESKRPRGNERMRVSGDKID